MKLSKAQQEVIDNLKYIADKARQYETAEEWFNATNNNNCNWNTAEKVKAQDIKEWKRQEMWFERERNAIYLVRAKTETVQKLESLGLIEVIERAKYKGDYELVKLLNY